MSEAFITITEVDHIRLREMMDSLRTVGNPFRGHLRALREELLRAEIVPSAQVDRDIVTMNSHVRVTNVDTGRSEILTLAYHGDCDMFDGRLSVLTGLGIRLLGQRVGDIVEWEVPAGVRRMRIDKILFQPEASGHFHL